jgi:hypothetical protein
MDLLNVKKVAHRVFDLEDEIKSLKKLVGEDKQLSRIHWITYTGDDMYEDISLMEKVSSLAKYLNVDFKMVDKHVEVISKKVEKQQKTKKIKK